MPQGLDDHVDEAVVLPLIVLQTLLPLGQLAKESFGSEGLFGGGGVKPEPTLAHKSYRSAIQACQALTLTTISLLGIAGSTLRSCWR